MNRQPIYVSVKLRDLLRLWDKQERQRHPTERRNVPTELQLAQDVGVSKDTIYRLSKNRRRLLNLVLVTKIIEALEDKYGFKIEQGGVKDADYGMEDLLRYERPPAKSKSKPES